MDDESATAPVLMDKRGHVLVLTLNRPEARNAATVGHRGGFEVVLDCGIAVAGGAADAHPSVFVARQRVRLPESMTVAAKMPRVRRLFRRSCI